MEAFKMPVIEVHLPMVSDQGTVDYLRTVGAVQGRLDSLVERQQVGRLGGWVWHDALHAGVGLATAQGTRMRNEDSAAIATAHSGMGRNLTRITVAAIADGMGGHTSGDRASAISVQMFTECVLEDVLASLARCPLKPTDIRYMLSEAYTLAHLAVLAGVPSGGSTLTCVLVVDRDVYIAHIGDSRAYLIDDHNRIELLTHDHRLVARLVDAGVISHEQAEKHLYSNVLYRAIGIADDFEADIMHRSLPHRGQLLLCTDGVWGWLDQDEICEILAMPGGAQFACDTLVNVALEHGSNDNATAILVRLP